MPFHRILRNSLLDKTKNAMTKLERELSMKVFWGLAVFLHIPIQIVKGKTESYLHVTLGAIIEETCGGGDVKLVTKN